MSFVTNDYIEMFFSNEMESLISCFFFGPVILGATGLVPESAGLTCGLPTTQQCLFTTQDGV